MVNAISNKRKHTFSAVVCKPKMIFSWIKHYLESQIQRKINYPVPHQCHQSFHIASLKSPMQKDIHVNGKEQEPEK
jgi:uncharacterized protein YpbB